MKNKLFDKIVREYMDGDLTMSEILASTPTTGLSVEDAFELYIAAMNYANGDKFYKIVTNDEIVEISTNDTN